MYYSCRMRGKEKKTTKWGKTHLQPWTCQKTAVVCIMLQRTFSKHLCVLPVLFNLKMLELLKSYYLHMGFMMLMFFIKLWVSVNWHLQVKLQFSLQTEQLSSQGKRLFYKSNPVQYAHTLFKSQEMKAQFLYSLSFLVEGQY